MDVKNKATRIDPPPPPGVSAIVSRDLDIVYDYALAKRWDRDVLEARGEDKLLAVTNEIEAGYVDLIHSKQSTFIFSSLKPQA